MGFFNDNITIFHFKEDNEIEKTYFNGKKNSKVYFRHNVKVVRNSIGEEVASTGTITIPTTEKLEIKPNDYVVEGTIKEEFDLVRLLEKYEVYKIISVSDNRKGTLQHYKIEVSE